MKRRDFVDMNEKNTFNRWLFAPWEADINVMDKEWPSWLTAPVHYQQMRVFVGIDWANGPDRVFIPARPGYRIVVKSNSPLTFYYEEE